MYQKCGLRHVVMLNSGLFVIRNMVEPLAQFGYVTADTSPRPIRHRTGVDHGTVILAPIAYRRGAVVTIIRRCFTFSLPSCINASCRQPGLSTSTWTTKGPRSGFGSGPFRTR
jgi:hypothetical protein